MSLVGVKQLVTSLLPSKNSSSNSQNSPLSENTPLLNPHNSNTITNDTTITTDLEANTHNHSSSNSSTSPPFPLNFLNKVDPRIMSDLIIGLSDGLTVPFALTAGLSSLGDTKLVITGGMAELVSGAISMGLGGYLAAKSESEFYISQVRKEKQLFFQNQDSIDDELFDILIEMGASDETAENFVQDLNKNPQAMIDFIIRYGKGLEEPPEGRIVSSALTIGSGYFFGGFIPLIPYFFLKYVYDALIASVALMIFTLFWFGYFKSMISMGEDCSLKTRVWEGIQMVLIGSIAAGSAWTLVYLIE